MLFKKRVISIDVSRGKYDDFINAILDLGASKKSSYVCVANVHMLVEAHKSPVFQQVVNEADLVTPDGMPIARSFDLLYKEKQDRVDGMSLLPRLLGECQQKDLSVYFYGGSDGMLNKTVEFIYQNYPGLKVAGIYSPPFRPATEDEKNDITDHITRSGANLVFVILGCPKQEIWMSEMRGKIPAVMIGVGGALPVLIGDQKRAPEWMQKNSLEWLYRLVQEPKRLFKRYFTTNSIFLYLLAKEKLRLS